MDVDQRVMDQVRVAREQFLVVDHHVDLELVAERRGQVGDRQGRDVPVPGVAKLGDPERPAILGAGLGLEVLDLGDRELVGGQLAAGRVVDDVLADPGRPVTLGRSDWVSIWFQSHERSSGE